jgi:serine/threonine protein kinase/WD40 repeat protein
MPLPENRAKSIFLNAAEIPGLADCQAYVEAECGADDALRREVEDLLRHHAALAGFLEAPACPAAAIPDAPAVPEGPGTVIGPYELLEQIGEGGFGVVFLAQQHQPIRRQVALKIIKPGMDTRQVIARFEAERQALALMDHPHIARAIDAGATQGGRPFFVMELACGLAITDYCDQHRLAVRSRLELFVAVCQAVQHAHQKGIIHRDLKPSNVLVTLCDGRPVVKVIDFGIAKAIGQQLIDKTLVTSCAQLMGTPQYMSPEQADTSGLDIDTRSDIYALGALLYELLTGLTPFDKERLRTATLEEIRRIIREEEPAKPSTRIRMAGLARPLVSGQRQSDPRRLSREFRRELDWIVMKCLEKDRDRRYETASDLARDVERYLRDEPVQAGPPSPAYRLKKFLRRNRKPVLAAAVLLLALVGGLIGTTWGLIRATNAEASAVRETNEKVQALAEARASERNAQDRLYLALVSDAHATRLSGRAGQRFDSLKALAQAARIAQARNYGAEQVLKLRNEAIACLALPDARRDRVLLEHLPHEYWVAFDPDFGYFAWSDLQGNVSISRVADNAVTDRLAGPAAPPRWVALRFSPDGRWLTVGHFISGRPPEVAVWEFHEGKLGRKIPVEHQCVFSPDSRFVAGVRADGAVAIYELPSGREVKRLAKELGAIGVTFHPDGRQLAVHVESDKRVLVVIDRETGKEVARYPHPQAINEPAWRGDGQLLAVGCDDQRIYVWDHANKRLLSELQGHSALGISVKFTHGGDFLISYSWDGTSRLWDPVSGRALACEPGARFIDISRDDGKAAVNAGHHLVLAEVTGGRECRTLHHGLVGNRTERPGHWGPLNVDISADGRLLVSASLDGARLWDLATASELAHLSAGITANALFHPDGNSLFTYGLGGLHRWPIRREMKRTPDHPNGITFLQVGPPLVLDVPANWDYAALSRDRRGRWLAAVDYENRRVIVLDLNEPGKKLVIKLPGVTGCELSPDGRWLATENFPKANVEAIKLWAIPDGNCVWEAPEGDSVSFLSPDGRWLVTNPVGDAPLRFWQLGSWLGGPTLPKIDPRPVRLIPSPDGSLLFRPGTASVPPKLLDAGTGKELATLEPPGDVGQVGQQFSPDGTRLAVGTGNHTIHVWDLRTIRRGLAEIGLDWDLPPYPPAEPGGDTIPIRVKVLGGIPTPK